MLLNTWRITKCVHLGILLLLECKYIGLLLYCFFNLTPFFFFFFFWADYENIIMCMSVQRLYCLSRCMILLYLNDLSTFVAVLCIAWLICRRKKEIILLLLAKNSIEWESISNIKPFFFLRRYSALNVPAHFWELPYFQLFCMCLKQMNSFFIFGTSCLLSKQSRALNS